VSFGSPLYFWSIVFAPVFLQLFPKQDCVPELPEVETVRRGLIQATLQHTIQSVEVLLPRTIAAPASPADFAQGLRGQTILDWQRRGKYLLAALGAGDAPAKLASRPDKMTNWLGVHLRMTGQLLWVTPETPLPKHTRVRLLFTNHQELRFVDQRTFGQMWWVPAGVAPDQVISGLRRLGPEPFSPEFSLLHLTAALQSSQRSIKTALLDQQLVAGIGNIYADEALFCSGIHPTQRCCDLQPEQLARLHSAIIAVLATSIDVGGTSFSTFLSVTGVNGNYGGESWVYNRKGQPCRTCGQPIERIKLAGRSTHFCPTCQPLVNSC
jgi:formamidopyrimidine-DNA glycosylase